MSGPPKRTLRAGGRFRGQKALLIAAVLEVAGVEGVVEVGVEGFPALAEFEVAVAEDDVAAAGFGVIHTLVGAVVAVGEEVVLVAEVVVGGPGAIVDGEVAF